MAQNNRKQFIATIRMLEHKLNVAEGENKKLKAEAKVMNLDVQYAKKNADNIQDHLNKSVYEQERNLNYIKELKARGFWARVLRKYE